MRGKRRIGRFYQDPSASGRNSFISIFPSIKSMQRGSTYFIGKNTILALTPYVRQPVQPSKLERFQSTAARKVRRVLRNLLIGRPIVDTIADRSGRDSCSSLTLMEFLDAFFGTLAFHYILVGYNCQPEFRACALTFPGAVAILKVYVECHRLVLGFGYSVTHSSI